MANHFLLGLDAGGGSGRCLLVDLNTQQVVVTARSWAPLPAPDTAGWGFDLDLETMWRLLGEATREALQRAGARPQDVVGLAATSMRHGVVVLDRNGRPMLAVPNRDARAAAAGMDLADERGQEFYQRTGHWPNPVLAAARLQWLASSTPAGLSQVSTLLSISEWLTYRLCGQIAADSSHAGESLLFDLDKGAWAGDLADSLGIPRSILPPVAAAGTRLGGLTAAAAAHLGLSEGTPVAVGGADTQCGLLGAGAVRAGQMGILAGTTAPLQLVLDRLLLDPQARLWTGWHVVPGFRVLESNAGMMGDSLEWIARVLYPEARQAPSMLDAEAAQSPPGAFGLVSTLGAQVFDGRNMGLPVGNLTLSPIVAGNDPTRRRHLARSVLEGLAYAVRANAEQLVHLAGLARPEYFLAGGMSRCTTWPQILAAVLASPLQVARVPEATALGAAICAGAGAGLFSSLSEGSAALVAPPRQVVPPPDQVELYQELYADWSQLRAAHQPGDALAGSMILRGVTGTPATPAVRAEPSFRPRILVTAQSEEAALARLRRIGEVTYSNYRETFAVLTGDDLVEALQGVHVLITEVDVVDAEALSQLPDLRLLASCRGNAVNIDVAACTAFGLPVLNTPGRNADAVADLTIAFLLMLARKLQPAAQFLRQPDGEAGDLARMGAAYNEFLGIELWRKTVGLVGMGAVGRGVARRLAPFGARVLVYDPYIAPQQALLAGAEPVSLETLLRESDFVSLHAPSTSETAGLLGAPQFALMKQGAFLVNTARAALVDEAALVDALHSGQMGGAALDVFSVEPPGPNDPLLTAPNVIATPHVGGNTRDVACHQGEIIAEELERIMAGERPRYLLNPETFDSFSWTTPRRSPSAQTLAHLHSSGGPAISDLDVKPRREPAPPAAAAAPTTTEVAPPTPAEAAPSASGRKSGLLSGLRGFFKQAAPETGTPALEAPQTAAPVAEEKGNQSAMLEKILRQFLAACEKEPDMQTFAAGRQLTMHYVLTDAGLEFYMAFDNGTVRAGMGAPPARADLTLKMKAEIFDGMMTGKVNGATAAMTGKLKFSGDTGKAMALQRVQREISRLYMQVRKEVGDPGDLAHLGSSPAPAAAPPAAPAPSAPAAPPSPAPQPARTNDERDEMIQVLQELFDKNLITATGGNISVRATGRDGQLWITPSALYKGSLRPDLMAPINLEGEALDPDAPSPSSERLVHSEILKARPELNAVIHAHAPWSTLLALTETPFFPVSTEAAFIGEIPRVPFIMPGTRELAAAVVQALGKEGTVVLLQNHGLVVAGSSLRRAASTAEVVERYAELILRCLTLGKQPPVLPEELVKSLREMGQMMA